MKKNFSTVVRIWITWDSIGSISHQRSSSSLLVKRKNQIESYATTRKSSLTSSDFASWQIPTTRATTSVVMVIAFLATYIQSCRKDSLLVAIGSNSSDIRTVSSRITHVGFFASITLYTRSLKMRSWTTWATLTKSKMFSKSSHARDSVSQHQSMSVPWKKIKSFSGWKISRGTTTASRMESATSQQSWPRRSLRSSSSPR